MTAAHGFGEKSAAGQELSCRRRWPWLEEGPGATRRSPRRCTRPYIAGRAAVVWSDGGAGLLRYGDGE